MAGREGKDGHRMRTNVRLLPLLLLTCVGACSARKKGVAPGEPAASAPLVVDAEKAPGPTRKAQGAAKAGERVPVAGGTLVAGSMPGDEGRDPALEPALLDVDLGPFEIDKLPFPNDPAKPARTDVTREEARSLCQDRGARLCTELEWERACKGPANDTFAAGATWDAACAKDPASCASGFGVLAMGGALREWTASDLVPTERDERSRAVVHGAAASADGVDHRCAHRAAIDSTSKAADLGFRCCKGPPNAAAVPAIKGNDSAFSRVQLDVKLVAKMCAAIPALAPYASSLAFFNEQEAIAAVLEKGGGGATAKPGPVLTTSPVLWSPTPYDELVVLTMRAKGASLILAFYRLPADRYRLASSLVLRDEPGPVVLAFSAFNRKRVMWSTCWECRGEDGAVEHRDGRRVVIVQR
jgi:formylglycine-generating enzyme required for sulfatase activity